MPRQVEFFRFWVKDEVTGKERRTSFAMDRPTAEERYPGCRPDERTRELRTIYEPGEAPGNTRPPHQTRSQHDVLYPAR